MRTLAGFVGGFLVAVILMQEHERRAVKAVSDEGIKGIEQVEAHCIASINKLKNDFIGMIPK